MKHFISHPIFSLIISAALLGSQNSLSLSRAAERGSATTQPPSTGLVSRWTHSAMPTTSSWDLGGQFRVRYEAKRNAGAFPSRDFLKGLDNSNDFYLFRTKAHLGWSPEEWFSAFAEGRDAHALSDARAIPETDAFDLHQAFLRFSGSKEFPLSLKIGRQELPYGNQRYVGISDWSNFTRAFDAAKLRLENELLWLDAFTGRPVLPRDGHWNVVNDYDWFSGIYASTPKLAPWQETEFFVLARNVGAGSPTAITPTFGGPEPRDIYTVGSRWESLPGQLGNWDYLFEAAGQFGSVYASGSRLEHRAFAINVTAGYTWNDSPATPRLAIGYDFGSGDSDPNDENNETFELLFGRNHQLYGLMDLFGLRNMHIPRLSSSIKPGKDLTVSLDWMGFWMANTADFLYPESGPGRNGNGYGRHRDFNAYVGNELEVVVNWRVASWGQLQAGYGHFFAGEYIRQSAAAGGRKDEDADWVYVQAMFSF